MSRPSRWIGAALASLVVISVVADTVYRAGPKQRTDLPVYLAGSERVLAGADPLLAESSRGWPYVYPPTLAVLVAPLKAFPIRISAGLWCLLSLGVLGAGLRTWRAGLASPRGAETEAREEASEDSVAAEPGGAGAELGGAGAEPGGPGADPVAAEPAEREQAREATREAARWELWAPLALVALPLLSGLLRGQVGPILLGCGLWAWCDLRAKRDLRAGVLLAFCAAIKLTPLLVILGLVAARRWRAVAGASLGLVLFLVLVPLPFLGVKGTLSSLEHFGAHMILRPLKDPGGHNMTSSLSHVPQNQALTSLAARHLSGTLRTLAFGLLGLLVVVALVRAGRRLDLASYGLLWGVPLLVAPIAWHHHHVVAFFALALLGARRARWPLLAFGVLALLHFAVKDLRPYGLLALGTVIVLALSVPLREESAADPVELAT